MTEQLINNKFFRSSSYPIFGTRWDSKVLKKFFKKDTAVLRSSGGDVLSVSDVLPIPFYQDIYRKVSDTLDKFYKSYQQSSYFYKGVNIPEVVRRELHVFLTEHYNKIHQLGNYQTLKGNIPFIADRKVCAILNAADIDCRKSPVLTLYYGIIDTIRVLKKRFSETKECTNRLNSQLYSAGDKHQKAILSIGVSVDRNKTFVRLTDRLKGLFDTKYSHQESLGKPEFDRGCKENQIVVSTQSHKKVVTGILDMLENKGESQSTLFQVLGDLMKNKLEKDLYSILFFVDFLEEVHNRNQIRVLFTGLTFYWLYNTAIQWARVKGVTSILLQDVFFCEDLFHNANSDYVITGSKIYREHLLALGYSESHIFYTADINNLLTKTPLSLKSLNQEKAKHYISNFLNEHGVVLGKRKLIFIASDPGDYLNTKTQKYQSERQIFEEAAVLEDYFVLLKLHPSDNGIVSQKALKDSLASNAIILRDIDFYQGMAAANVFISKYSTSVLEALIMNKFVLLMNHEKANLFQHAVNSGVAHYLEKAGDLERLIGQQADRMRMLSQKVKHYIKNIYFDEDRVTTPVEGIIENILERENGQ